MAKSDIPKENLGKRLEYDPNFKGPLKNRSCTDIICLLLFIVFIICWVAVGLFAFINGNPETLLIPRDTNGSRCGLDAHVSDKPYLQFFDLTKCIGATVPFMGCHTPQICVKQCPDSNFHYLVDPLSDPQKWRCIDGINPPKTQEEANKLIEEGKCAAWYIKSKPFLNRCLYNIADQNINVTTNGDEIEIMKNNLKAAYEWLSLFVHFGISFFTEKSENHQVGHDVVQDIKHSWKEIAGGILIGLVLCLIYIAMMRWIAGVMVWISIIGVVALLSVGVYYTATNYKYYKNHPTEFETASTFLETYTKKQETWLTLLIISAVVLAILLFVVIVLRKRIYLAVALIQEGSKAVSAATSALVFPIFPWILQLGVIIYVIALALYLSTTGSPLYKIKGLDAINCQCSGEANEYVEDAICDPLIFSENCHTIGTKAECAPTCRFIRMDNPKIVPYMHALNIIGFFWGICFMSAFGEMVLAATFATWYWTIPKRKVPFFIVTTAVLKTLRYHIGTLAFGSLIIAICKIIRAILEYIDYQLKKYDNEVTRAIMCVLKCFFWCLEKFLKFLNKNAYIMCAIHGKNFCLSAKDAFCLLMRNIVRVFVLDKVTDFLFFLSKLLVTLGVSAIMWSIIFYTTKDNYTYYYVPIIFVAVCVYLISSMFFGVYSMAVDTLFMCYLEDCERNDGSPDKPYFMSKNLGKIFGKKNKFN